MQLKVITTDHYTHIYKTYLNKIKHVQLGVGTKLVIPQK